MMRLSAALTCLLLPSIALAAQPAQRVAEDFDGLPLHAVSAAKLDAEAGTAKPGPRQVALAQPLALGLNDGRWSRDSRDAIWRTRIDVAGAPSLALHFSRLALPDGAALRLLDPDSGELLARYDASDLSSDGELWTQLVDGERLVLELRAPHDARDAVALQLAEVFRGTLGTQTLFKSGSCNIDVICSQGNEWRDEIRSTVLLQYQSGSSLFSCTGTLVNNTEQDDEPYVLSANHCGFSASNDDSVVAYFNFETSSCGGTPNGSLLQVINGAQFLDAHGESDFALLRLSSLPAASFDAYLAGWRVAGPAASSGVGIHHPSADEKRISVFSQTLSPQTVSIDGQTVQTWEVNWSQGTTEQGSSGSGLWDQDHFVVGVLSGGNASCSNLDGQDYYGRLELAWSNGLSDHLAPGSANVTQLGGKDAGASASNIPPAAIDDLFTADIEPGASYILDVLSNDSDPEGGPLTIVSTTTPDAGGSVDIEGDQLIWTPADGFSATESFDYTIADDQGATDSASVSISANGAGLTPVANDDAYVIDIDANDPAGVTFSMDVLGNDQDPEGGGLTIVSVSAASPNAAALDIDGELILITPDVGFNGVVTFSYTVEDASGDTDTASVSVDISDDRDPSGDDDDDGGGGGAAGAGLLVLLAGLAALRRRRPSL